MKHNTGLIKCHPTKPNLTLIGYSPYKVGGPEKIYLDTETDEMVFEKWEMNNIELMWKMIYWITGISLEEYKARYD